ncbi:MAG: DUF3440 domain-containing protein [Lachnospiraceae bacterium]|nr:DUF3440 domain-containing protein [Lachnospiraceae bacterium]
MKLYIDKDVYEAARERIDYCFREFPQILVAFSGGKDSTVLLNLCYDYAKEHGLLDHLAMYHLDYEAQYQMTTDFVTETFAGFPGIRKFWLCLPIGAQCACNMRGKWIPWEKEKRDIWVREYPDSPYLITEDTAEFKFDIGQKDYEVQDIFCKWFSDKYGKTAVVIGIRAEESWNRYKLVTSTADSFVEHRYDDKKWTVGSGNLYKSYPIYDWQVEDVWVYNGKFEKSYNKLYDLFYQAGLSIHQMRVASPFNDCAMDVLKLYKVIDPKNWGKMIGRTEGVNFAGLYGGTTAMGWRSIKLPKGHTWKSYCYFLLSTLSDDLRAHYERIFATSLKYWCEKGGFVSEDIMDEVEALQLDYEDCGKSKRYSNQRILKFAQYPDDCDTKSFAVLPSYKRMCVCILKNDYYCKYMGFSQTKDAIEKRKKTMEKYKNL